MPFRSFAEVSRALARTSAIACVLIATTTASAQVTIQDSEPGIDPVQATQPLGSQQLHLIALEDMTASTNSTLSPSLAREKRMRTFIDQNGMGQAFDAFKGSGTHDMSMTFEEALHQSILNVHAHMPTESGGSGDIDRQINAYTHLARSSWEQLQASMTSVQRMHDFLKSKGKVNAYLTWAGDQATAANKAMLARGEAAGKVARAHEAKLQKLIAERDTEWKNNMAKQRQSRLKWQWDVYKFNAKHGLTKTQLHELNDPYSGYRQYGDSYQDDGGWGLSSTGRIEPRGTTITR